MTTVPSQMATTQLQNILKLNLDVDEEPQFTSTSNFNIDENSLELEKLRQPMVMVMMSRYMLVAENFYLNDSNVLFFNNARLRITNKL